MIQALLNGISALTKDAAENCLKFFHVRIQQDRAIFEPGSRPLRLPVPYSDLPSSTTVKNIFHFLKSHGGQTVCMYNHVLMYMNTSMYVEAREQPRGLVFPCNLV